MDLTCHGFLSKTRWQGYDGGSDASPCPSPRPHRGEQSAPHVATARIAISVLAPAAALCLEFLHVGAIPVSVGAEGLCVSRFGFACPVRFSLRIGHSLRRGGRPRSAQRLWRRVADIIPSNNACSGERSGPRPTAGNVCLCFVGPRVCLRMHIGVFTPCTADPSTPTCRRLDRAAAR